ncbi:GMC family oxidoreductase [Albidovulum sp.]
MAEAPEIVIGSGPAGVAAAAALLARGQSVLLLDGGRRLEPEAEARRAALAARDPDRWDDAERDRWMQPQFAAAPGQVRRYGSDFAMERPEAVLAGPPDWFALRASHAVGGLSNLWGAAVLPYAASDMAGWPISAADLAPHYRAVAQLMPIAGRSDELEALFDALPMAGRRPIAPPPQAAELLARIARGRQRLARHGLTAGAARQAVDAACRRCGLCLHGCPFGLIWKAGDALARLAGDPRLDHRPGLLVQRLEEDADGVTVHLRGGGTLSGARVFLGAGVLETARILMVSGLVPDQIRLRDSQHAFLPMLHRWRNRVRPDRPPFHTLPQVFVELRAAEVSPHLVHAQLYTWNEHYARDLIASHGRRLPLAAPLLSALARRLIVAQIFLHSDHSHQIALRLDPAGLLAARLEPNPGLAATLEAAARRIGRGLGRIGLAALTFATRPGPPGSSFHAGASVPMAERPRAGQSDPLGRPAGSRRIHLVDATSLPAIPATTITLPVMANAHRIAASAG